jgi:phage baseplate assembly protein W
VATDPTTDFGTDVDCRSGVPLRWGLISGRPNVVNALIRRYRTVRGTLPNDPEYGFDLRDLVNAGLTTARLSQARSGIVAQALLEPRIRDVTDVTFAPNLATNSLIISMTLEDALGPFPLVLSIDRVTVAILATGQIPTPAAAGAAVVVDAGGGGSVGPAGGAGPSGPPGPSGSGGGGIELSTPSTVGSTLGSEELVEQLTVDFSVLSGGTLAVSLAGRALSGSGTATVRLYIGGTYGTIDGTMVCSATTTSASFAPVSASTTTPNPTGIQPVKFTIQSSGSGVDAQLERGATVNVT